MPLSLLFAFDFAFALVFLQSNSTKLLWHELFAVLSSVEEADLPLYFVQYDLCSQASTAATRCSPPGL
jgi:hypothetical protein